MIWEIWLLVWFIRISWLFFLLNKYLYFKCRTTHCSQWVWKTSRCLNIMHGSHHFIFGKSFFLGFFSRPGKARGCSMNLLEIFRPGSLDGNRGAFCILPLNRPTGLHQSYFHWLGPQALREFWAWSHYFDNISFWMSSLRSDFYFILSYIWMLFLLIYWDHLIVIIKISLLRFHTYF